MADLLVYMVRSLIIVLATWLVTNFIGKKSFAQMTPYDLAVLFIVSNVAAQPLVNKDSFKTAFGMVLLGVSIIVIARLSLHRFFYQLDYSPSILIARGRIDREELRKNRMSIYTLLSMLRVQGYFKVSEVNYAILESGGDLSVLPKAASRPVTPEDIQLKPEEEGLTFAVILDGQIVPRALAAAGVSEAWLRGELKAQHGKKPEEVLYAEVDISNALFVSCL